MAQKKPVTIEDLDLNRLPLPLVTVLDRFQEETNPFRKVNRLLDVMEVFLKLHTVAVVSDVFDGGEISDEVKGILASGLKKPSLGVWWGFCRDCVLYGYHKHGHPPLLASIIEAVGIIKESKGKPAIDRPGYLAEIMQPKNNRANMIAFRNHYGHGATPEDEVCKADIDERSPFIFEAISKATPLMELEWIWTNEEGEAFSAKGRSEEPVAIEGVGANRFYLRSGDRLVSLHPLLVRKEDGRCYFYNEHQKADFLNYDKALHQKDKGLARDLLERYHINEWGKTSPKEFEAEVERYAEDFKGRVPELKELIGFCQKPSGGIRMIWGGPGIGKSALMARMVQLLKMEKEERWEGLGGVELEGELRFLVVDYFIRRNSNEDGQMAVYFLKNLCERLDRIKRTGRPLGTEMAELRDNLKERLEALSRELDEGQRLVLFIDGLDEGVEERNLLESLPAEIPNGIVLLLAGRDVSEVRKRVWQRLDRENRSEMTLRPLEDDAIRAMLTGVVSKYDIQSEYVEKVREKSQGNPLYLKLLLDELYEDPSKHHDISVLPASIESMYQDTLERVSKGHPRAHDLLCLLAESRSDLTESIMGQLLDVDENVVHTEIMGVVRELLRENETTEDVDDYQLFHESLRVHLVYGGKVKVDADQVRVPKIRKCEEMQSRLFDFCFSDWEKEWQPGRKWMDIYGLQYAFTFLGEHARIRFAELKSLEKLGSKPDQRWALFQDLLELCDRPDYREQSFDALGSAEGVRSLCLALIDQVLEVVPESKSPTIAAKLILRFHEEPEVRYQQTLERLDRVEQSKDIAMLARAGQSPQNRVMLAVRGVLACPDFRLDNSLKAKLDDWIDDANDDMLRRWVEAVVPGYQMEA